MKNQNLKPRIKTLCRKIIASSNIKRKGIYLVVQQPSIENKSFF